ncbi:tyrosine-type recombinase/integrase [Nonomuraea sp. FMUSA5-5]|uniref:Tyrosine-type recombinase/integrase n=1 Tax=Nonomuraea composti TaxID=2720023 RepID=A0ABX1BFA6_9ACTN|nr:tyrosine-type recombinase/integrase [Nonomuraea sp. FMUSA5-5]NJP96435.1 tyrosine-type recombinase/integrase [Nonomuraea sp. FMUSA5-5]
MKTTYDVKLGGIQQRSNRDTLAYIARWRIAGKDKSKSFRTKGLATAFMSDLRQATKVGEEFDVTTGLPVSMLAPESIGPSFLEFAQSYVLRRWNTSAARTRETDAYALLSLVPALVTEVPRRPTSGALREVLRNHVLLPQIRRLELTAAQAVTLTWLERASLPLAALGEPHVLRTALEAISVTFAGSPAGANTVRRKRAVLHHLLEHAVEQKVFDSNPMDGIKWTAPKAVTVIDPRTVVNPAQARQLLDAVPKVGRNRGARLKALFACIYYAALRPEEAADLRQRNCILPASGWGMIVLEKARPQGTKRWTNSGETHESRNLKHRADKETREIPIPPVLVAILREHIAEYGTARDGRIFHTGTGGTYSSSAHSYVWQETRKLVLSPEQITSSLAGRPYDLRHAAVSLWLNAGVPAVEVAKRAGHSVEVLLRVYAKCMDGQQEHINSKIADVLTD